MLRAAAGLAWLAAGIVLVLFAIANRGLVAVSVDPFGGDAALSARLPLFIIVFGAVIVGIVLGGLAARLGGRRRTRQLQAELRRRDEEARRAAATAPQLPAVR
jgi:uncharacterized integral membrane protein